MDGNGSGVCCLVSPDLGFFDWTLNLSTFKQLRLLVQTFTVMNHNDQSGGPPWTSGVVIFPKALWCPPRVPSSLHSPSRFSNL